MVRDPQPRAWAGPGGWSWPWLVAGAGLALVVAGQGLTFAGSPRLAVASFAGGFLALGVAVMGRFRTAGWQLHERAETAALLLAASAAAVWTAYGLNAAFDSARMLAVAGAAASGVGAVLVLLPSLARRVVVSVLLLFHFAGMLVAVTCVDPPNGQGPWLSKQLWARVYRPYLSFMYLSNAYHFYSPDPGPPTLLWFAVHYGDDDDPDPRYTWVRIPDRNQSPVHMHYQRMLALPEHSFAPNTRLPFSQAELDEYERTTGQRLDRDSWEVIYRRREAGSQWRYNWTYDPKRPPRPVPIPMVLDLDLRRQYLEPVDAYKKMIQSLARHVFWQAPAELDGKKVRSVKVYRLVHEIPTPYDVSKGMKLLEESRYWPQFLGEVDGPQREHAEQYGPNKYLPYFLGEFNGDGTLINPHDPFLYWYLPVVFAPRDYPGWAGGPAGVPGIRVVSQPVPKDHALLNCMELHARTRVPLSGKPEKKP